MRQPGLPATTLASLCRPISGQAYLAQSQALHCIVIHRPATCVMRTTAVVVHMIKRSPCLYLRSVVLQVGLRKQAATNSGARKQEASGLAWRQPAAHAHSNGRPRPNSASCMYARPRLQLSHRSQPPARQDKT